MLRSSARRPFLSVLAAVLALGVVTGLQRGREGGTRTSPTPIASLNTGRWSCRGSSSASWSRTRRSRTRSAASPTSDSSYGNGDEVEVTGVGNDVVHELGCAWTGKNGTTARAWVFARPVTTDFARSVIASGEKTKGCRTIAGPPYGKPAATQLCRLPGGEQRLRHAGLFGQTWLTCELATTDTTQRGDFATARTSGAPRSPMP